MHGRMHGERRSKREKEREREGREGKRKGKRKRKRKGKRVASKRGREWDGLEFMTFRYTSSDEGAKKRRAEGKGENEEAKGGRVVREGWKNKNRDVCMVVKNVYCLRNAKKKIIIKTSPLDCRLTRIITI